jgi:hypothetical protein
MGFAPWVMVWGIHAQGHCTSSTKSLPVNITGHLEAPFSILPKQSSTEISLKSLEITRVELRAPV